VPLRTIWCDPQNFLERRLRPCQISSLQGGHPLGVNLFRQRWVRFCAHRRILRPQNRRRQNAKHQAQTQNSAGCTGEMVPPQSQARIHDLRFI
jgi:hypothetical protein